MLLFCVLKTSDIGLRHQPALHGPAPEFVAGGASLCLERPSGGFEAAQDAPSRSPASTLRRPLPPCPVAINWGGSVYFGHRKCAEPSTATPFLDLPRLTFELCCSQSSPIYQMGETFRQVYKLLFSFFGSATATFLWPRWRWGMGVGARAKNGYFVSLVNMHPYPRARLDLDKAGVLTATT